MFLVGGENLIDFIQDAPDGGYPAYRAIPGGAPFNVAKAIARQGVETGYLTPFSTDPLGGLLADHLGSEAHLHKLAPPSERPTSLAVVSLTDGQARYQFYREGTAERDVSEESLIASVPETAVGMFIGSLAITDGPDALAWTALFDRIAGEGKFTALDPNIRAAFIHDRPTFLARLEHLMTTADLIKLSDEDIAWLRPGEPAKEAARAYAAQCGADLFVLTMGAEGAVAFVHGEEVMVPVHPVPDLKDTVGAGDTFMGTLITQCLSRGYNTRGSLSALTTAEAEEILKVAAKAAAINCGRVGCNPPLLSEL